MPYVVYNFAAKLNTETIEAIKYETAQLIKKIAGKDESWLYIQFNDKQTLYFKGDLMKNGAIIEIKLVGSLSTQQKQEITTALGKILDNELGIRHELGIHPEELYIIFTEVKGENWGWNGQTFG